VSAQAEEISHGGDVSLLSASDNRRNANATRQARFRQSAAGRAALERRNAERKAQRRLNHKYFGSVEAIDERITAGGNDVVVSACERLLLTEAQYWLASEVRQ
jgi:hypothetical protein